MLSLLGAHIVGRSHECDYPEHVRDTAPALTGALNAFKDSQQMHEAVSKTLKAGKGLYWLDAAAMAACRPDVVVTQSLCSVCAVDTDLVREAVATINPQPVILDTNPMSLEGVIADVQRLGEALGLAARGAEASQRLRGRVQAAVDRAQTLAAEAPGRKRPVVVFLEWVSPLFPGGHWTPQMIEMAGGACPINPPRAGGGAAPSFELDPAAVVAADPDLIVVAPCGLDLAATRREMGLLEGKEWWRGLRAVRCGRVALADGNQHFNRPGPRLVEALEWLVGLLAPPRGQHDSGGGGAAAAAAAGPGGEAAGGCWGRPDLMPAGFPWEWLGAAPAAEGGAAAEAAEASEMDLDRTSDARDCEADDMEVEAAVSAQGGPRRPPAPAAALLPPAALHADAMPLRPATPQLPTENGLPHLQLPGGSETAPPCGAGQAKGGAAGCCGGDGDSADPWVVRDSPWAVAPGLTRDIEDAHEAACEAGQGSYIDPVTGYTVFTALGLAGRGTCCANRCRHCPWGHHAVAGRPRANRLPRPALLGAPAGARRGAAAAPRVRGGGDGLAGGGGGALLVCVEAGWGPGQGGACSAAELAALAAGARGGGGGAGAQRVALLVAFDAHTGELWGGHDAGCAAAGSSSRGSGGGAPPDSPLPAPPGPAPTATHGSAETHGSSPLHAAMDASLALGWDLVAVPLQVAGTRWMYDTAACAHALSYVVRTAGELLKASVRGVASASPATPRLFVDGTAGCAAGGWAEVVARAAAAGR